MNLHQLSAKLDKLIEFQRGYQSINAAYGPISRKVAAAFQPHIANVPYRGSKRVQDLARNLKWRRSIIQAGGPRSIIRRKAIERDIQDILTPPEGY